VLADNRQSAPRPAALRPRLGRARCAWASTGCLEQRAWLDAAQGSDERCRAHGIKALDVATRAGFRSARARLALGLLELEPGRAQETARVYETIDLATLLLTLRTNDRSGHSSCPREACVCAKRLCAPALDEQEESDPLAGSRLLSLSLRSSMPDRTARPQIVPCGRR
jgi:hypothetical protein